MGVCQKTEKKIKVSGRFFKSSSSKPNLVRKSNFQKPFCRKGNSSTIEMLVS